MVITTKGTYIACSSHDASEKLLWCLTQSLMDYYLNCGTPPSDINDLS
jgi:hypothetical protein